MKQIKQSAAAFLALLLLFLSVPPTAFAAVEQSTAERRVVRVAYPKQTYLTEVDSNGNYDGYSYEYLKKVAEFANWKLEYITYSDKDLTEQIRKAMTMVEEGEADLLGVMLRSPEMEERYLYPEKNYGVVYTTLEVLDSNIEINAANYMRQKPLRVAVMKKAKTRNEELWLFAKNSGLEIEPVYCETVDGQIEAVKDGTADALLNVSLSYLPGTKQIAEFSPRPYYFLSTLGNEELMAELDAAITKINVTDPYFESRLRDKHFKNTMANFELSETERAYVENKPNPKVLLVPQYAPFCFLNHQGELSGMSVSILNDIGKKTGIEFEYHALGKQENIAEQIATGEYDVVIGPPHSDSFADCNGLVLSQPYLDASLTMFINRDAVGKPKSECVLGLLNDLAMPINYEYKEIRYYNNIQECLAAVNRGEADYGYGSQYVIDFYTAPNVYKNLSYLNLSGYSREIGFYVPNTASSELLSIFNKYVRSMPIKDVHSYLSLALAQKEYGGVRALIQDNPLLVIVVTVTFLFLLLLIGMLVVYSRVNKKRNEKLQLAFSAKSEFLSRMSHDMRTPMNGIIGLTGLTLELEHLPPEVVENLSKIDESAQYLLSLINDTLDMNKIESNKIVLNKEATNLEHFFDQMIGVVKVSADQKPVRFIVQTTREPIPLVSLDKVRVQQIFFNLVSNAIKFTPPHGTVEITGKYERINETQVATRLTIKDDGIGIDKEFLPKIFEPFEQEYNTTTTNYAGSGLGLAIVKNLVDMMGGSVSVTSEKGSGSVFVVELTFEITDEESTVTAPTTMRKDALCGKRILLCEDHPLNAQIATKLLEKQGILVEHAENGQIAVDCFQKGGAYHYDAILMDIRMPVMGGLEATATIRAAEQADAKRIPIIAMTANAFDEDMKKSLEAGMNAHLAKPINPALLMQTLYEFICD